MNRWRTHVKQMIRKDQICTHPNNLKTRQTGAPQPRGNGNMNWRSKMFSSRMTESSLGIVQVETNDKSDLIEVLNLSSVGHKF